ncbi:hypothetical protein EDC04DRAFT_678842 [Pisolithus marmoratus]|nr:hypothetical protein EDC04DRAFT_678842 [Pisolithus marmoratus]
MSIKTIVVMGPTGSGKSTFINSLVPSGSSGGVQVGHNLWAETRKVQPIELNHANGFRFKLVDTPGFDGSREGTTDIGVLSKIAAFLVQEKKRSVLAGLIYMHRISDTGRGDAARRNLSMFHKICGQASLKNVVIVTTMWDEVTPEEGELREQELRSSETLFQPLLDEGAVMCRHDSTPASASAIVDRLLCIQRHTTTQIVHELLYEQKSLEETAAGAEIRSELLTVLQKLATDIRSLEERLRSTTTSTKDELAAQKRELELSINKLNKPLEDLKRRFRVINDSLARRSSVDSVHHSSRGNEIYDAPHDFRVDRNDPVWGKTPLPSINPLFIPQASYITNCTQLLHLANRIPNIWKMTPSREDVMNYTSVWTLNFASTIGQSIDNTQHGIDTLESMAQLRNKCQLQNLASHFVHTMRDTESNWRNVQTTMAKKIGEYQAVLLAEQGAILTMLLLGGRKRYLNVLQAVVEVMKLVLADMNSTIEWWASISNRVRTWGEVTRQPMSGNDLNVMGGLTCVTHALELYREGYQNVSQELRKLIESVDRDQGYAPLSQPLPVKRRGVRTTSGSTTTL